MKIFPLLPVFALAIFARGETTNWNRAWETRRADETQWSACHLPHSAAAPYFLGNGFYTGDVFYRKFLEMPDAWRGKKIFLEFEAAFQKTKVFVNGNEAGAHVGGYTSFRVDLTPHLNAGTRNEIFVCVNNVWDPCVAPRAGEHVFAAGIYRDVCLRVVPPVHFAYRGISVSTPHVSAECGNVSAEILVENSSENAVGISVFCRLKKTSAQAKKSVEIPARGAKKIRVELPPVPRPKLWSPDAPHLYVLETELRGNDGEILETQSVPVGFRWFEWTADKGFFLNGKHLFLLGANVHQGQAGWGDGVTDASHERDVKMMKDAGFNFIRGSHYPHDPAFLDACDRLGMLYWSEGGIWGIGGARPDDRGWNATAVPEDPAQAEKFLASAERQIREMIRDAKNHPCVIAWSVSNEPFFVPAKSLPRVKKMLEKLVAVAHEEDPTRPAAIGGAQRGNIDKLSDIAGYNGDGARIFQNPGVPNIVAEYGSASEKRPGTFAPHFGDFADKRPPWRAGAAIWCGFDHGSIWESGQKMGIVDFFRLPKQSYYWYRRNLCGIAPVPVPNAGKAAAIRLCADKTLVNSCSGKDDALIAFQLLDAGGNPVDADVPVTLEISGAGEFPTGKKITFAPDSDIRLAAGAGAIVCRSNFSGEAEISASGQGLKPAKLRLRFRDDADVPAFDPQKSRETPPRPYVKFREKRAAKSAVDLALNRPCGASSNAKNACRATDGDPATAWLADAADPAPFFALDLEFRFPLDRVETVGSQPLKIEISADGKNWRAFAAGTPARHVRLHFARDAKVFSVAAFPQD